jgi:hypothetical protein
MSGDADIHAMQPAEDSLLRNGVVPVLEVSLCRIPF